MTVVAIRKKLITYVTDAEDSKVQALYMLLEREIEEGVFAMSDEELQVLEMEEELYLKGEGKSYSREESMQIIKGQRSF